MTNTTNTETDPAVLRALAAMAQKRADRAREAQLDEESRRVRGADYAISRLRTP